MATEPPERDVKDFDFIQLCRFRVAPSDPEISPHRGQHVACSSQYGILFYATKQEFCAVKTSSLMAIDAGLGNERMKTTVEDIPVEARVNVASLIMHLAVSSDGSTLAVTVRDMGQLSQLFFDVHCFGDKSKAVGPYVKHKLATGPDSFLADLAWNPAFPELLAACTSDGGVHLICVKDVAVSVGTLPASVGATCLCWSPKGKQLLVGKRDGTFTQYDHSMAEKRQWPKPAILAEPHKAVDVVWQSTYVFVAAYLPAAAQPMNQPLVVMTSSNKEGNSTFFNYDDACFGRGEDRKPQYYFHFLQKWEMILMASSNATEATLVGKNLDDNTSWEHWNLEDTSRAELPLTKDQADSFPTGMAVDYSPQAPLVLGETKKLQACPVMYLLSTDGILVGFHLAYSHPRAATPITSPAQPLNPAQAKRGAPCLPASGTPSVAPTMSSPALPAVIPGSQNTGTPSIFGQAAPGSVQPNPSIFGQPSIPSSGQQALAPGSGQPKPSIFGQPTAPKIGSTPSSVQASTPTSGQPKPSLFGQVATPSTGQSSLFGQTTSAAPASAMPFNLSGQPTVTPGNDPPKTSLFGQAALPPGNGQAKPSVFGQPPPASGTSLKPTSLFGQASVPGSSQPSPSPFGQTSAASSPFGQASPATTGQPKASLFAPAPAASGGQAKPTAFGQAAPASSSSSGPPGGVSLAATGQQSSPSGGALAGLLGGPPAGASLTTGQPKGFTLGPSKPGPALGSAFVATSSALPGMTAPQPATGSPSFFGQKPAPSLGGSTPTSGQSDSPQQPAKFGTLPPAAAPPGQPTTKSIFGAAPGQQTAKAGFGPPPPGQAVQQVSSEAVSGQQGPAVQKGSLVPQNTPAKSTFNQPAPQVAPQDVQRLIEAHVDDAFTQNIQEEIADFEKELADFRLRSLRQVQTVGSREELQTLRQESEKIVRFLEEIQEATTDQLQECQDQKSLCFNLLATAEECKNKQERDQDPHYHSLLSSRVLDPGNAEKLRSLQQMSQTLEQSVVEVDRALEAQWDQHTKGKKTEDRLRTPTGDKIYKTIRNNNLVISNQRRYMAKIEEQLKSLSLYNSSSDSTGIIAGLSGSLHNGVSSAPGPASPAVQNGMTPEKMSHLRDVLTQRKVHTVKSVRPASMAKSRIVSVRDVVHPSSAPAKTQQHRTARNPAPQTPTGPPGVQLRIQKGLIPSPDPAPPPQGKLSLATPPSSTSSPRQQATPGTRHQQAAAATQPARQPFAAQPQQKTSPAGGYTAFSGTAFFKQPQSQPQAPAMVPSSKPGLMFPAAGPVTTPVSSVIQPVYEDVTPTETDETNDEDEYDEGEDNGYEEDEEDEEETGFVGLGPSMPKTSAGFGPFAFGQQSASDVFKPPAPVAAKAPSSQAFTPVGVTNQASGSMPGAKEPGEFAAKTAAAKDLFGAKASTSTAPSTSLFGAGKPAFGQATSTTEDVPEAALSSGRSGSIGFAFNTPKLSGIGTEATSSSETSGSTFTFGAGQNPPAAFGQKTTEGGPGFTFGGSGSLFSLKSTAASSGFGLKSTSATSTVAGFGSLASTAGSIFGPPKGGSAVVATSSTTAPSVFGSMATPSRAVGFADLASQESTGPSSTVASSAADSQVTSTSAVAKPEDKPEAKSTPSSHQQQQPPQQQPPQTSPGSLFGGKSPPSKPGEQRFSFATSASLGSFGSPAASTASGGPGLFSSPVTSQQPSAAATSFSFAAAASSGQDSSSVTAPKASSTVKADSGVEKPSTTTSGGSELAGLLADPEPEESVTIPPASLATSTTTPAASAPSASSTSPFSAPTTAAVAATTAAATSGGSVFGGQQASSTSTPSTFSFGAAQPTTSAVGFSGFGSGSGSGSTTPVFGSSAATTTTQASTPSSSLFGVPAASSAATTTTASTPTPSLFGSTAASSSTPSVFGGLGNSAAATIATTSTTTPSLFGGVAASTAASPFASGDSASSTASTSLFGAPKPTTTPGSLFGGNAGSSGATTASAPSVFGGAVAVSTSGSLFGGVAGGSSSTTSSPFGAATSGAGFSFGTAASPAGASTDTKPFGAGNSGGGGLFSGVQQQTQAGTPFGQSTSTFGQTSSGSGFGQAPAFGQQTSSSGGSLFGSSGSFGLGGKPSEEKAKQNVFGTPQLFGSGETQTQNLFGSSGGQTFGGSGSVASSQSSALGGGSPAGGAFSTGSAGVASAGFGTASGFGGSPAFGGSPSFGSPSTFGSAQGAGFGSAPAFGSSSPAGAPSGSSAFGSGFSSFANASAPSFGQLASTSTPAFGESSGGSTFGSSAAPVFDPAFSSAGVGGGGGGGGFGSLFGGGQASTGTPTGFGSAAPSQGFGSSPSFNANPAFSSYRG